MFQSKTMFKIICFVIISVFLLGCGDSKPIKIGMVAGLSGRKSQLGVSARNAVLMAVKLMNDKGGINGRKIELIIKDNKGDVEECSKVINELIDEGAIAIVGPVMSKMAKIVLKTIKGKNILVISPTMSTDSLKNIDDNFLRVMPVASYEAQQASELVIKDGHNSIAVVYDSSNNAYTEPVYMMFQDIINKKGRKITYVNNMSNTENQKFAMIAKDIINIKPDALYIISSGIDAAFLCQQIRKTNPTIKFYGVQWVKAGKVIEQGGSSVEGLVIVAPYERENKSDKYNNFKKTHKEMFKSEPNFVSTYSFEAAEVLFAGMEKSKKLNAEMIKIAILRQKNFQGMEEDFQINEYGDAIRSNMILVVKNGEFIRRP